MDRKIRIKVGAVQVTTKLNETNIAQAIWEALPIKGQVNRWGDEIYFPIPVSLKPDTAQELENIGDLGYWPPGNAFVSFSGQHL